MLDMRDGKCPFCQHDEIIQADLSYLPQSDEVAAWEIANRQYLAHPKVAMEAVDRPPPPPLPSAPAPHRLSILICRSCGQTQGTATEPGRIPIGSRYGTRLITGPKPQGPYR